MNKKGIKIITNSIIIICYVIGLSILFLLTQPPVIKLGVSSHVIATVQQPVFKFWTDSAATVYNGTNILFRMYEGFLDGRPVFIYPFPDGKRYLCDYDYDTAMLDFIVDFDPANPNRSSLTPWPLQDNSGINLREGLLGSAKRVVYDTKGTIRLPSYEELNEVTGYLQSNMPPSIHAGYFQFIRFLAAGDRKFLLLDLATNRDTWWPIVK